MLAKGSSQNKSDDVIQNICEGKKDIDAMISASNLVTIALKTIIPKIEAFCPAFPWRVDEFVVRDTEWVDLAAHDSSAPYFYFQCLHATRKDANVCTFKPKQFALFVVVPATQWADYKAFIEPGTPPTDSRDLVGEVSVLPTNTRSTFLPTRISGLIAPNQRPSLFFPTTGRESATSSSIAMKRAVVSPPPTSRSPPRKIPAIMPFSSVDRSDKLKEALKYGGTPELNISKGECMDSSISFKYLA